MVESTTSLPHDLTKSMQINIGILGLGTVGCGTLDVLKRNAAVITPRAGCEIVVKRIATKHPDKPRPIEIDKNLVTDDVNEILNDPDIKIVAELIGGVDPARDYVLRAIAAGKSVVTANKELIAKHGVEIIAAAEKAGVDFLFEGSVGGGIPLINPLRESLAANRVRERVTADTWSAFELTAIRHQSPEQVASELSMAVGTVYVARCRVLKLLRGEVEQLEQRFGEDATVESMRGAHLT